MIDCGNRLIQAQEHENRAGDRYCKRRTSDGLKEWKEARRLVESLATEYAAAIRFWRESLEAEIGKHMEADRSPLQYHNGDRLTHR